jgi:hypothetical protein
MITGRETDDEHTGWGLLMTIMTSASWGMWAVLG